MGKTKFDETYIFKISIKMRFFWCSFWYQNFLVHFLGFWLLLSRVAPYYSSLPQIVCYPLLYLYLPVSSANLLTKYAVPRVAKSPSTQHFWSEIWFWDKILNLRCFDTKNKWHAFILKLLFLPFRQSFYFISLYRFLSHWLCGSKFPINILAKRKQVTHLKSPNEKYFIYLFFLVHL